jgi:hypothetical protein
MVSWVVSGQVVCRDDDRLAAAAACLPSSVLKIVKYIDARRIQLIPQSNQVVTGALRIDMLHRLRHRPKQAAYGPSPHRPSVTGSSPISLDLPDRNWAKVTASSLSISL